MTDENKPIFKAPPLPDNLRIKTDAPAPMPKQSFSLNSKKLFGAQVEGEANTSSQNALPGTGRPVYSDAEYLQNNFVKELNLNPKILDKKIAFSILGGIFFFGLMMGCTMFSGSGKKTVYGLTDVVVNQDIKYRLPRCGQTNLNNECVLYIMNAKTSDRLGNDFFQEAQNITGVPQYTIRLSNVNYANALIRPGYIAQIYIPRRN